LAVTVTWFSTLPSLPCDCGHEFGGDNLADVSRNGALRDAQPDRILENTARSKVARYRPGYAELK